MNSSTRIARIKDNKTLREYPHSISKVRFLALLTWVAIEPPRAPIFDDISHVDVDNELKKK